METITAKDLRRLMECGILDTGAMLDALEDMERKRYLEMHHLSVWQGDNGYFYTKLPDEKGNKKMVRKKTRKALDDIIIQHYKAIEDNPTVEQCFKRWIAEKLEYEEISKGSCDRYYTDYTRFFKGKKFASIKISDVEEQDIEAFVRKSIMEHKLTKKTYSGLRTLILGIFKYAKKKGYTTISITSFFSDLQLPTKVFQKKIKDKEAEFFTDDEVIQIRNYCMENPTIWNLGVWFAFVSGVRVGELSALLKTDIGKNCIHIQRTEVKYRDEETGKWVVEVGEYPKTEAGDRYVVLPQHGMELAERICRMSPESEYMFVGTGGKRIRGNTFNKRLTSICEELNIKHRSFHKIRKTYATQLIDSKEVPDSLIMSQMGHSDILTTKKYYYRGDIKAEKSYELINKIVTF